MLNRRPILILALLVVLGGFGYGLVQLFNLRFASGDVYPPYSSLRGDPLGCRVYFESLDQLDNEKVRRFLQSLERLPDGPGVTLFVFGLPWSEMSAEPDEYQALEGFVRRGGRLVITLYPELSKPRFFNSGTNLPTFKRPGRRGEEDKPPPVNLREKWGFGYDYISTIRDGSMFAPAIATRVQPGPFPTNMSWHSGLVFTILEAGGGFTTHHRRGDQRFFIARQKADGAFPDEERGQCEERDDTAM